MRRSRRIRPMMSYGNRSMSKGVGNPKKRVVRSKKQAMKWMNPRIPCKQYVKRRKKALQGWLEKGGDGRWGKWRRKKKKQKPHQPKKTTEKKMRTWEGLWGLWLERINWKRRKWWKEEKYVDIQPSTNYEHETSECITKKHRGMEWLPEGTRRAWRSRGVKERRRKRMVKFRRRQGKNTSWAKKNKSERALNGTKRQRSKPRKNRVERKKFLMAENDRFEIVSVENKTRRHVAGREKNCTTKIEERGVVNSQMWVKESSSEKRRRPNNLQP